MSASVEIFVLTIRFANQASYELMEILQTLGNSYIAGLTWGIRGLDWLGTDEPSQFNRQVDEAAGHRLLVSGERLLKLAEQAWQVIEGEFVGYLSDLDAQEFLKAHTSLARFKTSHAAIGVTVKDGRYFDVYLRSRIQAERLARSFPNAQWQNPDDFSLD